MPHATTLQLARLRTLALTRDITRGRYVTRRGDRKLVLAQLLDGRLTEKRATRIIARWEAAPVLLISDEQTPEFERAYAAQARQKVSAQRLYKCCIV